MKRLMEIVRILMKIGSIMFAVAANLWVIASIAFGATHLDPQPWTFKNWDALALYVLIVSIPGWVMFGIAHYLSVWSNPSEKQEKQPAQADQ